MTLDLETEFDKFDKKQYAFDFLHSEYRYYLDLMRKTFDNAWEIYKFYLTAISGLAAVFLGIVTLSKENNLLVFIGSLFSAIMFVLGISLLLQLIYSNMELSRFYSRLLIIRNKLSSIPDLEDYFNLESIPDKEWVVWHTDYSIKHLLYRSIFGAGIKTQVVLINSVIGTIGLYLVLFMGKITSNIKLISLIILCFTLLISFQGILSYFKWKSGPKH